MFYRQVKNFLGGKLFVESRGTGVGLLEVSVTSFCSSLSCLNGVQPRSQGPLSTSRKYPGYGWSRVYACQLKPHRGWVLNLSLSTLSREVNVALLQT